MDESRDAPIQNLSGRPVDGSGTARLTINRRDLFRLTLGERGLRIDHCESCGGYLKTYDGQGNESLLLSDWSSLHLDLIAHDRGLKRLAASLYEFEPVRHP